MSYNDIISQADRTRSHIELNGFTEQVETHVDDLLALLAEPVGVYVVAINHKAGTNISAFSTYPKAMEHVLGYVLEWYETELGHELPDVYDASSLVSEYFDAMSDSESYEVEQVIIDR